MKGIGQQAEEIVDGIIADMTDRSGLRQGWDDIDCDTQAEIRATWMLVARRVLEVR